MDGRRAPWSGRHRPAAGPARCGSSSSCLHRLDRGGPGPRRWRRTDPDRRERGSSQRSSPSRMPRSPLLPYIRLYAHSLYKSVKCTKLHYDVPVLETGAAGEGYVATVARTPDADEEAVLRFVEQFALVLVEAGIPRMPARVFAYVLAVDADRHTAAELAAGLRVSPAAISGAVRYLVQVGLLGKERAPRSRRGYYPRIHEENLCDNTR